MHEIGGVLECAGLRWSTRTGDSLSRHSTINDDEVNDDEWSDPVSSPALKKGSVGCKIATQSVFSIHQLIKQSREYILLASI